MKAIEAKAMLKENDITLKSFARKTGRSWRSVYGLLHDDKILTPNTTKTLHYIIELQRLQRRFIEHKYEEERIKDADGLLNVFKNISKKSLADILGVGVETVYLVSSKRKVTSILLATANIYLELEYYRALAKGLLPKPYTLGYLKERGKIC